MEPKNSTNPVNKGIEVSFSTMNFFMTGEFLTEFQSNSFRRMVGGEVTDEHQVLQCSQVLGQLKSTLGYESQSCLALQIKMGSDMKMCQCEIHLMPKKVCDQQEHYHHESGY